MATARELTFLGKTISLESDSKDQLEQLYLEKNQTRKLYMGLEPEEYSSTLKTLIQAGNQHEAIEHFLLLFKTDQTKISQQDRNQIIWSLLLQYNDFNPPSERETYGINKFQALFGSLCNLEWQFYPDIDQLHQILNQFNHHVTKDIFGLWLTRGSFADKLFEKNALFYVANGIDWQECLLKSQSNLREWLLTHHAYLAEFLMSIQATAKYAYKCRECLVTHCILTGQFELLRNINACLYDPDEWFKALHPLLSEPSVADEGPGAVEHKADSPVAVPTIPPLEEFTALELALRSNLDHLYINPEMQQHIITLQQAVNANKFTRLNAAWLVAAKYSQVGRKYVLNKSVIRKRLVGAFFSRFNFTEHFDYQTYWDMEPADQETFRVAMYAFMEYPMIRWATTHQGNGTTYRKFSDLKRKIESGKEPGIFAASLASKAEAVKSAFRRNSKPHAEEIAEAVAVETDQPTAPQLQSVAAPAPELTPQEISFHELPESQEEKRETLILFGREAESDTMEHTFDIHHLELLDTISAIDFCDAICLLLDENKIDFLDRMLEIICRQLEAKPNFLDLSQLSNRLINATCQRLIKTDLRDRNEDVVDYQTATSNRITASLTKIGWHFSPSLSEIYDLFLTSNRDEFDKANRLTPHLEAALAYANEADWRYLLENNFDHTKTQWLLAHHDYDPHYIEQLLISDKKAALTRQATNFSNILPAGALKSYVACHHIITGDFEALQRFDERDFYHNSEQLAKYFANTLQAIATDNGGTDQEAEEHKAHNNEGELIEAQAVTNYPSLEQLKDVAILYRLLHNDLYKETYPQAFIASLSQEIQNNNLSTLNMAWMLLETRDAISNLFKTSKLRLQTAIIHAFFEHHGFDEDLSYEQFWGLSAEQKIEFRTAFIEFMELPMIKFAITGEGTSDAYEDCKRLLIKINEGKEPGVGADVSAAAGNFANNVATVWQSLTGGVEEEDAPVAAAATFAAPGGEG